MLALVMARFTEFDVAAAFNGGRSSNQNNGWTSPTCGNRAGRRVQRTITSTAGVRNVLPMPLLPQGGEGLRRF
jgi:hypothetical protein